MEKLKQMPIWVCCKIVDVNGRKTKIPCAAGGGSTGTSKDYAHTWVTYDEAIAAMKRHGYAGIGFIIPEGTFFIDKDHIDPNDPLVQMLLKMFPTYAERSYSGNGVHFYGFCDLSRIPVKDGKLDNCYYTKNPHNGMEVYIGGLTNRFALFTGDALQDLPLVDCTDALLELLETEMLREKETQPVQQEIIDEVIDEDDPRIEDIIAALRWDKNAPKFVRLFDNGDITGYGKDRCVCCLAPRQKWARAPTSRPVLPRCTIWIAPGGLPILSSAKAVSCGKGISIKRSRYISTLRRIPLTRITGAFWRTSRNSSAS